MVEEAVILYVEHMKTSGKVLFTTPVLKYPAKGGPQLRIENSIKALSRVCELHVLVRAAPHQIGDPSAEAYFRRYCAHLTYSPSAAALTRNRYMRKLQRAWREMTACSAERDASYIAELVQKHATTVVWFGHGQISFPLIRAVKALLPDIKVVCDTDSVWSRFILRELPFQPNPLRRRLIAWRGRRKEKEERQWVNLCEITTAVSEIDAAYYRESAIDPRRVRIFANAIDIENYTSNPQPPPDLKKPCIYLAGTFGHYHSPMDVAARWVLDEVLPRLRRRIPDIHFYIVGRDSDRTLAHRADKHVSVKGMLASVLPYLRHADVAIVPLKFESGTRFKILEAGACGVPLVSTTLGAEGLPVIAGKDILIADSAEQFANAIIRLIESPVFARAVADSCKTLIREHYSVERLTAQGRDILESLAV